MTTDMPEVIDLDELAAELQARDTTWMDDAACIGEDPDLFFPTGVGGRPRPGGQTIRASAVDYAQTICARCPVRDACAAFGDSEQYGIWGGIDREAKR